MKRVVKIQHDRHRHIISRRLAVILKNNAKQKAFRPAKRLKDNFSVIDHRHHDHLIQKEFSFSFDDRFIVVAGDISKIFIVRRYFDNIN